mmetsp:Transcript_57772/g.146624  ORF Transcript_57772/g.146624 Transcript_57772/m.146624 type:complete len:231 (+) Transcript_57772:622-1314(+)
MHMKRAATKARERMLIGCVFTLTTPTISLPAGFSKGFHWFSFCTCVMSRRKVSRSVKNSSRFASTSLMRRRSSRTSASSKLSPKSRPRSSLNSHTPLATSSIVPRCWLRMLRVSSWYSSSMSPATPFRCSYSTTCRKLCTYAAETCLMLGELQKPNGISPSLTAQRARPTLRVSCSCRARNSAGRSASWSKSLMDLFSSVCDAMSDIAESRQRPWGSTRFPGSRRAAIAS